MVKILVIAMVMACALNAAAEETLPGTERKQTAPDAKKASHGIFQSTSNAIGGFRPKPWLLRPMKPAVPAKEGKETVFQNIADSMKGSPTHAH